MYIICIHKRLAPPLQLAGEMLCLGLPLGDGPPRKKVVLVVTDGDRHRLNGYLAKGVPSLFLAGSSGNCLNCAVPKGMFPCRTRYGQFSKFHVCFCGLDPGN